ncbi:uncharacterized protein F4817DRAFT_44317 [Daldinia loculata]|uniref:uncharacterized protein n=1 Tax=Daldinia loculata TaxID=103429 RepID=UPI0020C3DD61|nr:uncharacterized protein F4817DRAFT_44317 [Daldinia loculata]KAI1649215.1 hypothetical protein F4817DRAFT_44317 [Daldinia loculata]
MLQDNLHIVRLINLPNNPLRGRIDRRDWIILEWLEHGELRSFITKARIMIGRGTRLPNRLLWRFFTCLVRCCIAMAWPDSGEEVQRNVELSGIVHGDLHQGNGILITQARYDIKLANMSIVLLGEPPNDDEHGITPILKLIDFGGTEQYPPSEDADNQNVYDIGQIMLGLINLNRGRDAAGDNPFYTWGDRRYRTEATALIPTPDGVDHALCTAVCACMAEIPSNRPSLNTLLRLGLRGVNETAEAYDNALGEQDDIISLTWKAIVYDAPTADDDELTDDWSTSAPSTAAPSVGSPSPKRPRPMPPPAGGSPSTRPSSVGSPSPRHPSTRHPDTPGRDSPFGRLLFPPTKATQTPGRTKRNPSEDSAGIRWE